MDYTKDSRGEKIMGERKQPNRWRCLQTGCNPILDEESAKAHKEETQHRVAKWPVRSREGQKKAHQRNRSGYYDKYNVGAKSYQARFGESLFSSSRDDIDKYDLDFEDDF